MESLCEKGKVFSINYSKHKGTAKLPISSAMLVENLGLENDAHAGNGLRQISLIAYESIKKQKECEKIKKADISLSPGDFGENITTEGINTAELKIGYLLHIGRYAVLEITKIGKECHKYCAIYYKTGNCIMPKEGIFARVLKGGTISVGDTIEVEKHV